jgi:hypothetical protein
MAFRSKGTLTGTAAALGSITGLSDAKRIVFNITGLTSETITVTGLVSGTIYTTNALRPIDLSTGTTKAASTMGNGDFMFDNLVFEQLKFTKSSTSETAVVTYRVQDNR